MRFFLPVFAGLVGAVAIVSIASVLWTVSAPAAQFTAQDFSRKGAAGEIDRAAFVSGCFAESGTSGSPARRAAICACKAEAAAAKLSRAEFAYVTHVLRAEMRQASGVLKAFAAAGRDRAEYATIGARASEIIKSADTGCFLRSLTPSDMARIRRYLEQVGIAPAAGALKFDE